MIVDDGMTVLLCLSSIIVLFEPEQFLLQVNRGSRTKILLVRTQRSVESDMTNFWYIHRANEVMAINR